MFAGSTGQPEIVGGAAHPEEAMAHARAEAVRRLLEAGLAHDNRGPGPVLSDGEKLIAVMLSDLIKKLGVDVETNVDLVQKVIYGGHYWALGWEMQGIFHGHADKQTRVRFVVETDGVRTMPTEPFCR